MISIELNKLINNILEFGDNKNYIKNVIEENIVSIADFIIKLNLLENNISDFWKKFDDEDIWGEKE